MANLLDVLARATGAPLVYDPAGAVARVFQGLPITEAGALATNTTDAVARHTSGIPLTNAGRVATTTSTSSPNYHNGLRFTGGKLVIPA